LILLPSYWKNVEAVSCGHPGPTRKQCSDSLISVSPNFEPAVTVEKIVCLRIRCIPRGIIDEGTYLNRSFEGIIMLKQHGIKS
jgi:hypothetical protein